MPRPDPRAPGDGQNALFAAPMSTNSMPTGNRTKQIDAALAAVRTLDGDSDVYAAIDAAISHCGRVMDSFESKDLPYGMAKLASPYLELLNARHMTPESRRQLDAGQDDTISELLRDLATPEIRDSA